MSKLRRKVTPSEYISDCENYRVSDIWNMLSAAERYQIVHGKPYQGALISFGEEIESTAVLVMYYKDY